MTATRTPLQATQLADLPAPPAGRHGWPWTEGGPAWPDATPSGRPWPAVSIVTPSYNQAAFLEETLRSVLLQGCPRLEYIVVDGGSTDGSVALIERYAPWLAAWVSERDRGQSHALNKGFARATGEIVAWINSDDALRPGAIRAALAAFDAHPGAVLVYGRASDRDEHGVPMNRFKGRPFTIDELLEGANPIAQPSAFIRRAALGEVGPLDEALHYAMDYDLWLRLATIGEVVFVDEVWSDFRHWPASKSGTSWSPFLVDIHAALERVFAEGRLSPQLARRRRRALGRSHLTVGIDRYWQGQETEARRRAVRALLLDPTLALRGEWKLHALRCLLGPRIARRLKALLRRSRTPGAETAA